MGRTNQSLTRVAPCTVGAEEQPDLPDETLVLDLRTTTIGRETSHDLKENFQRIDASASFLLTGALKRYTKGRCGLVIGAETTAPAAKIRGPTSEIDYEKVRITRVRIISRAIVLVSLAKERQSTRNGPKIKIEKQRERNRERDRRDC
ncbi:hypothetical protein HN011_007816 [Eciton burchellii]|nr:hypothetical protein HN011_007816 [Eciton burchellii]